MTDQASSNASAVEAGQPWYANGLPFACTGCGNCCTGAPGAVWVSEQEIAKIAAHTGLSMGEVRLGYTRRLGGRVSLNEFANGDCVFFEGETRRCKIYAARPEQCQTWPFWRSNLESPEAWRDMQQGCPGARQGPLVTLERIRTQSNRSPI